MRRIGFVAAAMFLLTACQPQAPADPLAQARAQCSDSTANADRIEACSVIIDAPDAEAAERTQALLHRADARRASGQSTAALRDYDAVLAAEADNAGALIGRGAILLASGQLDAAQPLLARALNADPAGEAHELLGRLALQQGDAAAAIAYLDAAIARNSRNAGAYAARARAKLRKQDEAGARNDFDAAIRADGALAEARAGRCWLDLTHGENLDRARNDAEAAAAANPQLVEGQLCRGILQLRGGEWEVARASFEAALAVEPGNPTALFGRGVARRRSGDNAGTRDMNQARDFDTHIGATFDAYGVNTY